MKLVWLLLCATMVVLGPASASPVADKPPQSRREEKVKKGSSAEHDKQHTQFIQKHLEYDLNASDFGKGIGCSHSHVGSLVHGAMEDKKPGFEALFEKSIHVLRHPEADDYNDLTEGEADEEEDKPREGRHKLERITFQWGDGRETVMGIGGGGSSVTNHQTLGGSSKLINSRLGNRCAMNYCRRVGTSWGSCCLNPSIRDSWANKSPQGPVPITIHVFTDDQGENQIIDSDAAAAQVDTILENFRALGVDIVTDVKVHRNTKLRAARIEWPSWECVRRNWGSWGQSPKDVADQPCDQRCNYAELNFDEGRCVDTSEHIMETRDCEELMGNGVCDQGCNIGRFKWDGGDCCLNGPRLNDDQLQTCVDPGSPDRQLMTMKNYLREVKFLSRNGGLDSIEVQRGGGFGEEDNDPSRPKTPKKNSTPHNRHNHLAPPTRPMLTRPLSVPLDVNLAKSGSQSKSKTRNKFVEKPSLERAQSFKKPKTIDFASLQKQAELDTQRLLEGLLDLASVSEEVEGGSNTGISFDRHINIFVVKFARHMKLRPAGYAQPMIDRIPSFESGLLLDPAFTGLGRKIAVHELGHLFGLRHVFAGGEWDEHGRCTDACNELANGEDGVGDFCADTRATINHYECSDPENAKDCRNQPFEDTPFRNHMSYTSESCRTEFSAQQLNLMKCMINLRYSPRVS